MSGASPHVAFVCWGFPPYRGRGAHRGLALANGLAAAGAAVTVVAASREASLIYYGADTELERRIDPAIKLLRVPFYPHKAWPLLNDWPRLRATAPKKYAAMPDPARERFPESVYASWLPRVTEALHQLHSDRRVSLLIASGPPYSAVEAAAQASAYHQIPLVVDDRDSFLADVATGEQSRLYREREPFFRVWVEDATEMWFVNSPIADWHRRRFPPHASKFQVVRNGWDPDVVTPESSRPESHEPLRMGYIGPTTQDFPLEQVLAAWRGTSAEVDDLAPLQFFGPLSGGVGSPLWDRAEQALAAGTAQWSDRLQGDRRAEAYSSLDVLLLVDSGGAMVTGAQAQAYTATGLPIVAMVSPSSDTLAVLRGYPRLHVADPHDAREAAEAITAAIADRRQDDGTRLRAAQQHGSELSRTAMLTAHIDRILERALP